MAQSPFSQLWQLTMCAPLHHACLQEAEEGEEGAKGGKAKRSKKSKEEDAGEEEGGGKKAGKGKGKRGRSAEESEEGGSSESGSEGEKAAAWVPLALLCCGQAGAAALCVPQLTSGGIDRHHCTHRPVVACPQRRRRRRAARRARRREARAASAGPHLQSLLGKTQVRMRPRPAPHTSV